MRLNSFALLSLILGVLIPWAVSAGKGANGSPTSLRRGSDASDVQTHDQRSTGKKNPFREWFRKQRRKFQTRFSSKNRKDRSSDTSVGMGNGSQDEIGRPSGDDGVAAQGGVMNIEAPVQMPARGSKPKRKSRKGRSLCCFSSSADNDDGRSEAEDRDSRGAMDASSTTPQVNVHERTNKYFVESPSKKMLNPFDVENASSGDPFTSSVPPAISGSRESFPSRIRSLFGISRGSRNYNTPPTISGSAGKRTKRRNSEYVGVAYPDSEPDDSANNTMQDLDTAVFPMSEAETIDRENGLQNDEVDTTSD